jgi:hypothetical protein
VSDFQLQFAVQSKFLGTHEDGTKQHQNNIPSLTCFHSEQAAAQGGGHPAAGVTV